MDSTTTQDKPVPVINVNEHLSSPWATSDCGNNIADNNNTNNNYIITDLIN